MQTYNNLFFTILLRDDTIFNIPMRYETLLTNTELKMTEGKTV